MIILKKLTWSNCFSYAGDNELILNDAVLTQVLGANGVGKSSIPIIIEEVLFNKNSKNTKKIDIPNRILDGSYSMELSFSVDCREYVVSVERKKTLKIILLEDGKDISSHTATNTFKTIEGILGMDFKTFTQLVYQNTKSSLQFLTATDTNRKRFLIDLLNLDKYVEYFETFKELVKSYNTQVISLESKINTLEKWLVENNLDGMIVLPELNLEINLEEDEKALGSLTIEFENISKTNLKISKNQNYKKKLESIDLSSVIDMVKKPTEHLLIEAASYRTDITNAKTLISRFGRLSDTCPTCEQKIDKEAIEKLVLGAAQIVDELTPELERVLDSVEKIKLDNKCIDEKLEKEREFASLFRSIDTELPTETLDAAVLQEKINSLSLKLIEKRKEVSTIIAENLKRTRNNQKISLIEEQTAGFEAQLTETQEDLDKVVKLYNDLEILKKAFSTNGLLAYKIEYLVKELETIVNEYLGELSDGRFTLSFAVTKDKLNVHITDDGREVDILSLSSGELARVNTATLLAIRRLMNSISKSRINVLFLDEVISVLDDPGRERLVDVLVREDKLNTFIVSHEWSHPLLAKLNIVKEANVSRVDNGEN